AARGNEVRHEPVGRKLFPPPPGLGADSLGGQRPRLRRGAPRRRRAPGRLRRLPRGAGAADAPACRHAQRGAGRRAGRPAAGAASAVAAPRRRTAPLPLARGLLAAVLIEAVGIAALSAALWSREAAREHAPLYQTLSAPAEGVPRASIRAVLAPTLSLGELEALLGRTRLQIVGGPGDGGVYSLAPQAGASGAADALAQLRSHPGVRFAVPVNAEPGAP